MSRKVPKAVKAWAMTRYGEVFEPSWTHLLRIFTKRSEAAKRAHENNAAHGVRVYSVRPVTITPGHPKPPTRKRKAK